MCFSIVAIILIPTRLAELEIFRSAFVASIIRLLLRKSFPLRVMFTVVRKARAAEGKLSISKGCIFYISRSRWVIPMRGAIVKTGARG